MGGLTRESPRCDHLDVRLEAVESQLKADLVISFSSAAMGDEAGVTDQVVIG